MVFFVVLCVALSLYPEWFLPRVPIEPARDTPPVHRRDSFFGLDHPAQNQIWLSGTYGKVLRSSNHGNEWTLQKTPVISNLQDIASWSPESAVVVGDSNTILRTENRGADWSKVTNHPEVGLFGKLIRVKTYDEGTAFASGQRGMVMVSRDAGQSWHRIHPDGRTTWNDVVRVEPGRVVVVGEFGKVSVADLPPSSSEPKMADWTEASTPVELSLKAVDFRDPEHGVAVGLNGIVLKTSDGGSSWTRLETNITDHLWDVTWDDRRSRWFVAADAGFYGTWSPPSNEVTFTRLSQDEFDFHTEAAVTDTGYVLAGSSVGQLRNGKWELFPDWLRQEKKSESEGGFPHLSDWKVLPDWVEEPREAR